MERLFVYGTLAPGRKNHHVLASITGVWQAATVRGRLLEEGWGAQLGYPGFVPADDGEDIPGHVLSSNELPNHWSALDDFEGEGYRRVLVLVRLASGDELTAQIYALNNHRD